MCQVHSIFSVHYFGAFGGNRREVVGMNGSEEWQLGVQITDSINKRTLG